MTTQGVNCLLQLAKAESKGGLAEGWAKFWGQFPGKANGVCPCLSRVDGCVATTCGVLSVRALSSLPQNQTPSGVAPEAVSELLQVFISSLVNPSVIICED